ncbi:MAG TPA: alanine racemase [Pseudomonadales bacterium]
MANRRYLVDLEALAANYALFAAASPGRSVAGVVKADGYGVGAVPAAGRLARAGCTSFFVASAEEALVLRQALGAGPEIFALEGPDAESAAVLAAAGITPVLNHAGQLESWRPHAAAGAAIHVDTGMSRLGFRVDVGASAFDGMHISLLMTHLACADEPGHPLNAIQLDRFESVCRRFPGVRTSIGNSAACLTAQSRVGDLGRPGIGLYGGNPFLDLPNPCVPVAALQGRVLQVKELNSGDSVGYGASCVLSRRTTVAVVGIGYADGVPRQLSGCGSLFLAGSARPILGRVSMDLTVIDVTGAQHVAVGDWAECFGARLPVDGVAATAGTMAYTLLTGVGGRVPRVYRSLDAR